jgi:hypothetical protein
MKKWMILLAMTAVLGFQGMAQEKLKVGEVVNEKLKITREADLRNFLLNNLGKSGSLGKEFYSEVSPTSDRFLVYLKVYGNKLGVTTTGVLLVRTNNEVFIVKPEPDMPIIPGIGGSATYTCIGNPCTNCDIDITWPSGSWFPDASCDCAGPEGDCNMTVSLTFSLKVGLL